MKNKMQCPYEVDDLLSLSKFVSFCKENTTKTDTLELRFLEEQKLLLPCIKVHRGYIEYVKLKDENDKWVFVPKHSLEELKKKKPQERDKRGAYFLTAENDAATYFGLGGFHFGKIPNSKETWLDYYLRNDMVIYPATDTTERPEFAYKATNHTFVTDKKDLGNPYVAFYSKKQLPLLKMLKNRFTLQVKNDSLVKGISEKGNENIKNIFGDKYISYQGSLVSDYYEFLSLYNEIEDMFYACNEAIIKKLQSVKSFLKTKRELDTEERQLSIAKNTEYAKKIENKLSEFGKTIEYLESYRFKLMNFGTFNPFLPKKVLKMYLSGLDDWKLYDAEEVYRMSYILHWSICCIKGDDLSLRQVILSTRDYDTCSVCGRYYKKTRNTDKTCGLDYCKKEQKNRTKARARKSGRYNS